MAEGEGQLQNGVGKVMAEGTMAEGKARTELVRTWLTAGGHIVALCLSDSRWATVKFDTPMAPAEAVAASLVAASLVAASLVVAS